MSPPSARDDEEKQITIQLLRIPSAELLGTLRGLSGVRTVVVEGNALRVGCSSKNCASAVAVVLNEAGVVAPERWHQNLRPPRLSD